MRIDILQEEVAGANSLKHKTDISSPGPKISPSAGPPVTAAYPAPAARRGLFFLCPPWLNILDNRIRLTYNEMQLGIIPIMKHSATPEKIERRLITSLRAKGYKLTPQRREIISLLSKDMTHPGAMDILKKVGKKSPKLSMSTVYYTLDMLKKEGLIRELEFYDRDNRYDINVSNHINLICEKCGKIEDFPGDMPFSSEMVEGKTGFQPVGTRFEYYGYCKACRARRKR